MFYQDTESRRERIAGLVERYRAGEFSETVFTASLKAQGMRRDNIQDLASQHWEAHVQSMPYKRGDIT